MIVTSYLETARKPVQQTIPGVPPYETVSSIFDKIAALERLSCANIRGIGVLLWPARPNGAGHLVRRPQSDVAIRFSPRIRLNLCREKIN